MTEPKHFAALKALIKRLDETPLLSKPEEAERYRASSRLAAGRMIEVGETFGKASDDLALYDQTEEDFRTEIRNTDNDLDTQIARFNHGLDRWFEHGECHPPYFPWRIAIILSKLGEKELEAQFLASYCRHFWDRRGNRDEMIVARAEKKGAFNRCNRR